MARLWMSGGELLYTYTPGNVPTGEWSNATGTPTSSSATKRTGSASIRSNPSASTQFVARQIYASSNASAHVYIRAYIYVATAPSAVTTILSWADTSTGTTSGWYGIKMNTNRTLIVAASGGTTGTASPVIPLNTWVRVELDYDDAANTGTGYLDGASWVTLTGADLGGGAYARFGVQNAASADIFFDDFAVNDTTGSSENGLPGAGSVYYLRPNAVGDNNLFSVGAGGTAGTANNYTRVNEVTPDFATSYNTTANNNTTTIDDFNVTDFATAGIGSTDTIKVVQVGMNAGTDATAGSRSMCVRIKGSSGGTVVEGTAYNVETFSGWSAYTATAPRLPTLTVYTNPDTGSAWTPSALDTVQIGYRATTAVTDNRRVSTLWAMVEATPSTGTSTNAGGADSSADSQAAAIEVDGPGGQPDVAADAFGATVVVSSAADAPGGQADSTADAATAAVSLEVLANLADTAADAYGAVISASSASTAAQANATADSYAAAVTAASNPTVLDAAASVSGLNAAASVSAITAPADASVAAFNVQSQVAFTAIAGQADTVADGFVTAPVVVGQPPAGQAAALADAFNCSVASTSSVAPSALDAAVTADSYSPVVLVSTSPAAGQAAALADAYGPAGSVTITTSQADVLSAGLPAGQDIQQSAAQAPASADASGAGVSTSSSASGTASDAAASGDAFPASISGAAQASAGFVSVSADGLAALAQVEALAVLASVTSAAYGASVVTAAGPGISTIDVLAQAFAAVASTIGSNPWVIRPNTGSVTRPGGGLVSRPDAGNTVRPHLYT